MSEGTRRRGRPRSGVREAVLAATQDILTEVGVVRLTTREIARRAQVAESSIFYHFGDRLGLLRAVVETHLPLHREALADVGRRVGVGSLRENLVALLESLEAFYLRIAPILAAVQADGELRARFAERGATEVIGPRRGMAPIVDYLAREREGGRVRPDADLAAFALTLVGVAHQRAVFRYLAGADQPEFAGPGQLVDALVAGLATD